MSQNPNQKPNPKKEAAEAAKKKRTIYFVNIVFLSVLTIISLLFAVFTLLRARIRGTEGLRGLYTERQIERIREESAQEERNSLLLQIQSSLESGEGTTQMLREVFSDSIVVMNGGRYLFFPISDQVERNVLAPGMLSEQDGAVRYQAKSPSVELQRGVLLSEKNGRIDWDRLVNSGISEIVLTVGTISESGFYPDEQFERNCRKASEKGIPWSMNLEIAGPAGSDTLTSALEWVRAAAEAYGNSGDNDEIPEEQLTDTAASGNTAPETADGKGGMGRQVLLRIQTRDNLSDDGKEQGHWTRTIRGFCQMLEKEKLEPVIGAGMYTFAAQIDLPDLAEYDRWLVDHEENVIFPYSFSCWEYSSEGATEGVPGSSILFARIKISEELEIRQ